MISNYLLAGTLTFVSVFLKGFQHRNVNGNHFKLIAITSYFMATFDVLIIGTIVKNGIAIAIPCGTGAAIGMIVSIKLHDKLFKAKKG